MVQEHQATAAREAEELVCDGGFVCVLSPRGPDPSQGRQQRGSDPTVDAVMWSAFHPANPPADGRFLSAPTPSDREGTPPVSPGRSHLGDHPDECRAGGRVGSGRFHTHGCLGSEGACSPYRASLIGLTFHCFFCFFSSLFLNPPSTAP